MEFTLTSGALRAVVTTRGGELIGLWDSDSLQYIWEGDPRYWHGRNPHLFPVVGKPLHETVSFGGRSYPMKRHGFARSKEYAVVDRSADAITLELTQDADTLAQYPFPFRFRVVHKLLPNGFSTTFQVKNTGEAPMPFCVGGHTAFRCPLHPGSRFEDYHLVFDEVEDILSPTLTPDASISATETVKLLDHTRTLELDVARFRALDTFIFDGLKSKGVALLHKETGRGVRLDFSAFPMVAFWTAPGPFICLEPWHGCAGLENEPGDFTAKPHCIVLAPGEETSLPYVMTLV